jgi:hypothetical protein
LDISAKVSGKWISVREASVSASQRYLTCRP